MPIHPATPTNHRNQEKSDPESSRSNHNHKSGFPAHWPRTCCQKSHLTGLCCFRRAPATTLFTRGAPGDEDKHPLHNLAQRLNTATSRKQPSRVQPLAGNTGHKRKHQEQLIQPETTLPQRSLHGRLQLQICRGPDSALHRGGGTKNSKPSGQPTRRPLPHQRTATPRQSIIPGAATLEQHGALQQNSHLTHKHIRIQKSHD